MKTSDFYYDLPQELIAQVPLEDRSSSKLLILDKKTGDTTHKHFYDLCEQINSGDTLILGTKGGLRIPSTECWNGTFNKPMTIYHDVAGEPVETTIPLLKSTEDLWNKKIRSFLNAIITGGKAPVPTDEIIYNQAIIDGIFRSSELGREVEIESPEI